MTEVQQPANQRMHRRGAGAFMTAIAVGQFCALIRYVVLARILGPQELGWAVIIVLVGQFFDSITESGGDRFLIQHPRGGTPEAQRMVQLASLTRGVTIALILFALARPIADFMQAPDVEFGLRMLALVPLLNGLVHTDLRRVQRDHDFRIEGRAMLLAEVVSLSVTIASAFLTQSYIAIVFGLIARALTTLIVSHLMARRGYAARFSSEFGAALLYFGLPLMLNGTLLFFGSQGDRLIISRFLGPHELGRYSAAMLLIFYPSQILARYISGLYLPQIVRSNPARKAIADELGGVVTLVGGLATVGFAIVAPFALPLLFGKDFSQSAMIVALIGALNIARFIKLWPTTALLAEGASRKVLVTNICRLISFPLAAAGSLLHPSLQTILLAFIIGDLISILVSLRLAAKPLGIGNRMIAERILIFLGSGLIAVGWGYAVESRNASCIAAASVLAAAFAALLCWREGKSALALLHAIFPHVRLWSRQT
jgi:O-antigen/teichoic acid export membrane protein